ncbi:FERM domain-containing protein 4B-like [Arapaima gigas]
MEQSGAGEVYTSTGTEESRGSEELREKISALRKRVNNIEDTLTQKLQELKEICLKEAVLTGTLPKEYPVQPGESAPRVRQRIGAAFKLDDVFRHEDPHLSNLECRLAVQQKIVEAADKLAAEAKGCKMLQKLRKKNCLNAMEKLKEVEEEINQYRIKMEKISREAPSPVKDDISTKRRPQTALKGFWEKRLEKLSSHQDTQNTTNSHHHDKHFNRSHANRDTWDGARHTSRGALVANRSPFRAPSGNCGMSSENLTSLSSFCQTCCRSQSRYHLICAETSALCLNGLPASQAVQLNKCRSFLMSCKEVQNIYQCHPCRLEAKDQPSPLNCTTGLSTQRQWCTKKGKMYNSCGNVSNLGCSPACCHSHRALPQKPNFMYCCADPEFCLYEVCESDGDPEYLLNNNSPYCNPAYDGHRPRAPVGKKSFLQTYNAVRSSHRRDFSDEQMHRGLQRTLVLEHLQGWYHQSLNKAQGLQSAFNYNKEYKHLLGYQTLPALHSHSKKTTLHCSVPSASRKERYQDRVTTGQMEHTSPLSVQQICSGLYSPVSRSSPATGK